MKQLFILFGVLLIIFYIGLRNIEGFTTVNLTNALSQRQHQKMEGERRFNDMARLQHPSSQLPPDTIDAAFRQAIPVDMFSMLGISSLGGADIGIGKSENGTPDETGMVQQKINFCESLTNVDCATMNANAECGVCHRDGTNSKGKPHRGGMFISADDKARGKRVPTIGQCAPENFTMTSDACTSRELRLGCQKTGSATTSNQCGQCYGSTTVSGLLYMGPKPKPFTAYLHVSHPGLHSLNGSGIVVSVNNGPSVTMPLSYKPLIDPQQLIVQLTEGDSISITISGMPQIWCGWLSNATGTRSVSLHVGDQGIMSNAGFAIAGSSRSSIVGKYLKENTDWLTTVPNSVLWYMRRDEVNPGSVLSAVYGISQAVPIKDVTESMKIFAGVSNTNMTVSAASFQVEDPAPNTTKYVWISMDNGRTVIRSEGQQLNSSQLYSTMIMNCLVPATLADPTFEEDTRACPSGPIVLTEIGAGIMGSNTCFDSNGVFSPNVSCLQRLFISAGGTTKGTLYPTTDEQAKALTRGDMDATMDYLNAQANLAIYGVDGNGSPQPFSVVKAAALAMLGISMSNPCDGPTSEKGPHSAECLDYIWRTGPISGPPGSATASLPYSYCSSAGTSAPLNSDGTPNATNISNANQQGSVLNIRNYFQDIFNRTQDSSNFSSQTIAMKSCFGVNISVPVDEVDNDCPAPNPDEWQCFGPSKLQKPEVFHVMPGNRDYSAALGDAPSICSQFKGGRVASTDELTSAFRQGAEWCSAGWVSDSTDSKFPITTLGNVTGCGLGPPGVRTWTSASNTAGVNCFGHKPKEGTNPDIRPFNLSTWYNPNSLPPGLTVVGKEQAGDVYCASNDGTSCTMFNDEETCATFLSNKTPITQSVNMGTVNPTAAAAIDMFVRGRV